MHTRALDLVKTLIASEASSKKQCAREKERAKPTAHQANFFVYVL